MSNNEHYLVLSHTLHLCPAGPIIAFTFLGLLLMLQVSSELIGRLPGKLHLYSPHNMTYIRRRMYTCS